VPTITSEACTTCPTLITVARLSEAAAGSWSCSNAFTRSALRIAGTPRAFSSSAISRLAASAIQCSCGSRVGLSNGITRIRPAADSPDWPWACPAGSSVRRTMRRTSRLRGILG
jgi:hypothetical protein